MGRLFLFVGYAVTLTWVASIIADVFIVGYDIPPAVHGIMGIVAGGLYGKWKYEQAKETNGSG